MNVNTPTKSPGQTYSSAELNTRTNWINSPSQSLGAFNPAMTFDSQGQYNPYTLSSDIVLSASSIALFNMRVVRITANGTNSITFGAGIDKVITPFTNPLPAGDYWFYMASFVGPDGVTPGIHVSIPDVQSSVSTPPTITSMSVENSDPNELVVVFDEPVTATNVGYTFRINSTPETLNTISGSGSNTLRFGFTTAVVNGDTLDLSYDSSTGDTLNASLVELVSFTQSAVTNNVAAAGNWTTFSGTTHIYFGDLFRTQIGGADKRFAFEFKLRNWNDANIHRLFSTRTNTGTTNSGPEIITIASSDGTYPSRLRYGYRNEATPVLHEVVPNTVSPTTETLFRIEYDGSIDTAIEDRVTFYRDGTPQTSVNRTGVTAGFPFDFTAPTVWELSFGAARQPDGTVTGSNNFVGDAQDLKFEEWTGSAWNTLLDVPDISTGTDVSGNNNNGTFVA